MSPLFTSVFVASLLGSLHCAGMCGGIVMIATSGDTCRVSSKQAAYHVGRLTCYSTLGLIAGALGATFNMASGVGGVQRPVAVLSGALILVWGMATLLPVKGFSFNRSFSERMRRIVRRGLDFVNDCPAQMRAFSLGLLTTFLPCGWLYAFVIVAAGTGSMLGGFSVMLAFWAGTVPILLGLGFSLDRLSIRIRRILPRVTACAMIVMGLSLIFLRAQGIPSGEASNQSVGGEVPCPMCSDPVGDPVQRRYVPR